MQSIRELTRTRLKSSIRSTTRKSASAFTVALMLGVLMLSGCREVKLENGEIPAGYVELAKNYEGVYRGSMQGQKGELHLVIQGNRPVLNFVGDDGGNILGGRCDAKIGRLLAVKGTEKDGRQVLERARFAFDPFNCAFSVSGREMLINFAHKNGGVQLKVQIEESSRVERDCTIEVIPGGGAREICQPRWEVSYLNGKFTKI